MNIFRSLGWNLFFETPCRHGCLGWNIMAKKMVLILLFCLMFLSYQVLWMNCYFNPRFCIGWIVPHFYQIENVNLSSIPCLFVLSMFCWVFVLHWFSFWYRFKCFDCKPRIAFNLRIFFVHSFIGYAISAISAKWKKEGVLLDLVGFFFQLIVGAYFFKVPIKCFLLIVSPCENNFLDEILWLVLLQYNNLFGLWN